MSERLATDVRPQQSEARPVDLRLLPVAAGLWAGLALTFAGGRAAALGVALLVAVVGVAAGLTRLARRSRRCRGPRPTRGGPPLPGQLPARGGPPPVPAQPSGPQPAQPSGQPSGPQPPRPPARPSAPPPRWTTPALVIALLGLLLGLGLGAALGVLQLARLHPPELTALADQQAVVRGVVTVTSDPRASRPATSRLAPTWSVHARLTELVARGERRTLRAPVLLRGDAVRDLQYGQVVEIGARAEAPWSPHSMALQLTLVGEPTLRSPPGPLASATNTVRERLRGAVAFLPADAAALLLGLAVGDESTLSPELAEAMIRAGLAHLTAVSGSNFTIILALVVGLTRLLGLGRRLRILLPVLALAGYVELVRPQPSVLRAAAMGAVALLAFGIGGRRQGAPALLASVIVLLVLVPAFALSIGFALSVAATAALVVLAAPLTERLRRWPITRSCPEPVLVAMAAATAAHLATLPLSVLMGNGASLVAIPANLAVTPLVPPATVLGLVAALVVVALPAVATALVLVAAPQTAGIAWVARRASGSPHAVLAVPAGAGWAVATLTVLVAGGAVVVGLTRWSRGRPPVARWRLVAPAAALALTVTAVLRIVDQRWPPPDWVVLACDVGQGDALLVRSAGSSRALLVDTGPDPQALTRCLADAGRQRVVVVLTHLHADHIDGLAVALATGRVEALFVPQLAVPQGVLAQVRREAAAHRVPLRTLAAGDRLSPAPGVEATVLWPARRIAQDPENNGSVVLVTEVTVQGASRPLRVLLTGDIEEAAQARLMADPSPHADVVKVPHHGSAYQHPDFATWAGAQVALVTVGADNSYGHPAARTLDRYRDAGARVGRTDQQGALAISVRDGRPVLSTQR